MTPHNPMRNFQRLVAAIAAVTLSEGASMAQPRGPSSAPPDAPSLMPPPGQEPPTPGLAPGDRDTTDPYEAVRSGNELLRAGNATAALSRYEAAAAALPQAREIAFAQGLAHQRLGDFDRAREAFSRAAFGPGDKLTDDALYSAAACDHAEALQKSDDPKAALSLLESAMDGYQNVLSARPDHEAARDANVKAATRWRQIREILKQQQDQQQNQSTDGDKNQEEQEKNESPSESQESKEGSEQSQPQESSAEQQSQPSDENADASKQESKPSESEQAETSPEERSSESASDAEKEQSSDEAEKTASEEEEEQVSREQAERKLREMMQGVRDRRRDRREPTRPVRVAPVDKDW